MTTKHKYPTYLTFGCKIKESLIPENLRIPESVSDIQVGRNAHTNDGYMYLMDEKCVDDWDESKGPKPELGDILHYRGIHPHREDKHMAKIIQTAKEAFNIKLTPENFGYINVG